MQEARATAPKCWRRGSSAAAYESLRCPLPLEVWQPQPANKEANSKGQTYSAQVLTPGLLKSSIRISVRSSTA